MIRVCASAFRFMGRKLLELLYIGIVYQDVYGQAEEAFNVCMRILNGETFEQTTYVPFKLITKDNVDEYLANF